MRVCFVSLESSTSLWKSFELFSQCSGCCIIKIHHETDRSALVHMIQTSRVQKWWISWLMFSSFRKRTTIDTLTQRCCEAARGTTLTFIITSDQFSNKLRNVSPSSLLLFLLFILIFSSSIPRNKNPFQEVSRVSVSGLKFDGWVSVSGISRTNRLQRLETMLHSRNLLTTIKPISSLHSWIQTQNTSSGTSLQFDLLQKEPGLNKSIDVVMIQQFNTDGNLQLYNQQKIFFRRKSDMKKVLLMVTVK